MHPVSKNNLKVWYLLYYKTYLYISYAFMDREVSWRSWSEVMELRLYWRHGGDQEDDRRGLLQGLGYLSGFVYV